MLRAMVPRPDEGVRTPAPADPAPTGPAPAACGPSASARLPLLGRSRRWVLGACVLAWTGALVSSHAPAPRLPEIGVGDKGLHVAGFLVLTGLFWLTLAAHGRRRLARIAFVFPIMPLYAALDELTQPWFGRTCDLGDWLADAVGAACALALAELVGALVFRPQTAPESPRDSGG
jgi:VanZ family protein